MIPFPLKQYATILIPKPLVNTFYDGLSKNIGKAGDVVVKDTVRPFGFTIGERFGPWDIRYGVFFFDTKVAGTESYSYSDNEREFALKNNWTMLLFRVINETPEAYEAVFVGFLPYEKIKNSSKENRSKYPDKNGDLGWYIWHKDVEQFILPEMQT